MKDNKTDEFQVNFFGLCDHTMISGDGKLSLIGLFDRIFVTQLPAQHTRCFVVAIIRGPANTECDIRIDFMSPDGKEILFNGKTIAIRMTLGPNGQGNILNELVHFPIATTGEYNIRLSVDGKLLKEIPFYVQKVMTGSHPGSRPN